MCSSDLITIKDHKDSFPGKVSCRLINPAKTDLGCVAKQLLEDINVQLQRKTGVQQWRSTGEALSWFKSLPKAEDLTFLKFDIEAFYPSITKTLLEKAMNFANTIVGPISIQDQEIIMQSFQSFLFDESGPWVKKDNKKEGDKFDVTMGSYSREIGRAHV